MGSPAPGEPLKWNVMSDTAAEPRPAWSAHILGDARGRDVRVGVVDSGWDRDVSEPRVRPGVAFVGPVHPFTVGFSTDAADRIGHGTACADLILRLAPEAQIVPIRIFGTKLESTPEILHAALEWALTQELDVLNLSLSTDVERAVAPLYAACEALRRRGTVVVAAARSKDFAGYPAMFENVISVGVERFFSPYVFHFHDGAAVECSAWGTTQWVRWLGGRFLRKEGSSFAAANMAGVVALLREASPGATLEKIRELLRECAVPVRPEVPASTVECAPPRRQDASKQSKPNQAITRSRAEYP